MIRYLLWQRPVGLTRPAAWSGLILGVILFLSLREEKPRVVLRENPFVIRCLVADERCRLSHPRQSAQLVQSVQLGFKSRYIVSDGMGGAHELLFKE